MDALDATLKAFFASHHWVGTIMSVVAVIASAGHARGYYNKTNGPKK